MCSGTFRPSRSHTHTHTRCLLSYLPAAAAPGPRVCVCVRNGDGGGAARGVGFWLTSQAMLSNQRRARGPGAGIGAARGQFSITRSPGASGEERSRAGGRRPPRRLGPGTGCRARGPSRLPRPPAALFPQPLRSRLLERVPAGAAQGPRRQEGRPTAPGLTGTQESGHREGRVTRSRSEPELRGPGLRAGGAREQRPPRRGGGRCAPRLWALRAARASRPWDRGPRKGQPPGRFHGDSVSRSPSCSAGIPARVALLSHTPEAASGDPGVLSAVPACPCLLRPCQTQGVLSGPGAWGAGASGPGTAGPSLPAVHRRLGPRWPEAPRGTSRAVQRSGLSGRSGCRRRSVPGPQRGGRGRRQFPALRRSLRRTSRPLPGAPAPSGISDQLRLGST